MNLPQQLEDKKKGCGKKFEYTNDYSPHYINCGNRFANTDKILCKTCQAEIAILEQAIAEMQKQRQEILDKIDKFEKDNTISIKTKDLVKGKIIISDYIYWGDFRRFKEQLNQPKTSHSQGESQDNNKINNGGQNGN